MWRAQVNDFLRACIAHLRTIGQYDRVIAYQVAAGSAGEWIESWSSMLTVTPDYSAPMRRAFRDWLRRRYRGDVAALRAAWGDASASFETAQVPPAPRQLGATRGLFRDPVRERDVVDFFADGEKDPAVIARGEYATYQRSGHLGLRKVLLSPDIDFIVSPCSYGYRGVGGDGLPMQPGESLRRHGKLYLMEEDTRMHNTFDPPLPPAGSRPAFECGRMHPPAATMAVYRRNVAQVLTHGLVGTWMHDRDMDDFVENREPYWGLLARSERLGAWALELDRAPCAEVAVLLDSESFFHLSCRNAIDLPGIFQQKLTGLNRFGAPHDVYLLDDLLEEKLPAYKLYVFLNPWRLDDRRRAALARVVRRAGVHLYSEAGDVLYATRDLLAAHTAVGGERTFRLPRKVEVAHDLLDDRAVAADTDSFVVTLPPSSSSLWFAGTRAVPRKPGG